MSDQWIKDNVKIMNNPQASDEWLRLLQVAIFTEKDKKCELFENYKPPNAIKFRIDPSGACNFKCRFCPCNNADYMVNERHAIMSFDVFEMLIHDLQDFSQSIKMILELYGYGEPLLNKDLPDMILYAKQQTQHTCYIYNKWRFT